jgi:predicted nucleic acid-binding protein
LVIYLDTSAFIKLYLREDGSEAINQLVTAQDDPLPVWDMLEAELLNAFRLKVFWKELSQDEADTLTELFKSRKQKGHYHVPELNRIAMMETFNKLTTHTAELGCRTLDILHVACALQLHPTPFATYDQRQRALAKRVGLEVFPTEIK